MLCTVHTALAIDKRFVIAWRNNPADVVGTDKEVDVWWVSWQLNPNQSNDFDLRNLDTVSADPFREFGNHEVALTDLAVDDKFHVAIKGCNRQGICSAWTADTVVSVPPEPIPGVPDPSQPGPPGIVYIMMHPLQ